MFQSISSNILLVLNQNHQDGQELQNRHILSVVQLICSERKTMNFLRNSTTGRSIKCSPLLVSQEPCQVCHLKKTNMAPSHRTNTYTHVSQEVLFPREYPEFVDASLKVHISHHHTWCCNVKCVVLGFSPGN